MQELINLLFAPFNWLSSVWTIILNAIDGLTLIIVSIIEIILSITYILPYPFYPALISFVSVYASILIYKLIRKG